jgi:hypothetical protein
MIKMLLAVAVVGSVGGFAGLAMAQSKQGEAFGGDISSLLAKLEAQCAHRRIMPPDPRDDCGNKLKKLRSDAQISAGGASAGQVAGPGLGIGAGPGNGIGPGNGAGPGNGIGPGSGGGGGRGKGR